MTLPSRPEDQVPDPEVPGVRKRKIDIDGIRLHVAEAGKSTDPLVVFLHGFPEFWYEWREYLPHFAAHGYYAVAPDQRGYNLSDKPEGAKSYTVSKLAADVVGLVRALGREEAFIVGHDWGAAVAWRVAHEFPQMVRKVVIINVPHPTVFLKTVRSSPRQVLRSWYIFAFQLRGIAERMVSFRNWSVLEKAVRDTSIPGTFSEETLEAYRRAWSRPGAITGMINWYRGIFISTGDQGQPPSKSKIQPPLLLIWGARDHALGKDMAQPSVDRCQNGQLVMIEDATHWVVHEKTEKTQGLIRDFFEDSKGP